MRSLSEGYLARKGCVHMSVATEAPRLNTTGAIADRLGVAVHRIHYIIETRGIEPAAYAGRLRLFDREAVARIRHELNAIDARREGVSDE